MGFFLLPIVDFFYLHWFFLFWSLGQEWQSLFAFYIITKNRGTLNFSLNTLFYKKVKSASFSQKLSVFVIGEIPSLIEFAWLPWGLEGLRQRIWEFLDFKGNRNYSVQFPNWYFLLGNTPTKVVLFGCVFRVHMAKYDYLWLQLNKQSPLCVCDEHLDLTEYSGAGGMGLHIRAASTTAVIYSTEAVPSWRIELLWLATQPYLHPVCFQKPPGIQQPLPWGLLQLRAPVSSRGNSLPLARLLCPGHCNHACEQLTLTKPQVWWLHVKTVLCSSPRLSDHIWTAKQSGTPYTAAAGTVTNKQPCKQLLPVATRGTATTHDHTRSSRPVDRSRSIHPMTVQGAATMWAATTPWPHEEQLLPMTMQPTSKPTASATSPVQLNT